MAPKPHHERRKAAGIDAFTAQKGVARSIQTYKHKKESKLARKASLLRGYHKIMKQEGLLDEDGGGGRLRGKRMQPNKRNENTSKSTTPTTSATQLKEDQNQPERPVGHDDVNRERNIVATCNDATNEEEQPPQPPYLKKRKPKMNPLTKSLQKASEKKAEQEQERLRKQQELADRTKKVSQRKRDSKLLSKRTKKGQPIMKNIIGNLLSRIEQREQTPDL